MAGTMFAVLPGMEIIRLVTVHPMLVHFTLGGLPLIILAYAVAARRQSARWTVRRASMVVHRPSAEAFAAVAGHARSLQVLAGWLAAHGGEQLHQHGGAGEPGKAAGEHDERGSAGSTGSTGCTGSSGDEIERIRPGDQPA